MAQATYVSQMLGGGEIGRRIRPRIDSVAMLRKRVTRIK